MPTYAYVCGQCNQATDIFQSIKEGHRRKCPKCGALKLKRQIGSGSGVIFKGTGFHCTDYPKNSAKKSDTA